MASLIEIHHYISLFLLLLLPLLGQASTSEATQSPIVLQPYIVDYRNGTILRYKRPIPSTIVPPPNDSHVQSKDITFPASSDRNLRARVFLPAQPDPARKIPVLIYFHGGAFCIGSPFYSNDTQFVARVAAEVRVLVVAIDYRLYPEFIVPAPFDDAWDAFKWVASHASRTGPGQEPWLTQYGDLQRIFVGGESAGGTIAHNLAMRAGLSPGSHFTGLFLAMPYFLGSKRVPLEPKGITSSSNYKVWSYVCNNCTNGVDNRFINPFGPGPRVSPTSDVQSYWFIQPSWMRFGAVEYGITNRLRQASGLVRLTGLRLREKPMYSILRNQRIQQQLD